MRCFQLRQYRASIVAVGLCCCVAPTLYFSSAAAASVPRYVVPVRWCGVRDAPTIVDPDLSRPLWMRVPSEDDSGSNESEPRDAVLNPVEVMKFRSGNSQIHEAFTHDGETIVFQASIPSLEFERGRFAQSFPVIYSANWNVHSGMEYGKSMKRECIRAWNSGDELYYDENGDGVVNKGDYRLGLLKALGSAPKPLKPRRGDQGLICTANIGAPLERLRDSRAQPGVKYGYVDENDDGSYSKWEPIYRYNDNGGPGNAPHAVNASDILLFPVTSPGAVLPRDTVPGSDNERFQAEHIADGAVLLPLPEDGPVKFVDKFLWPPGEFSIGYGSVYFNGIYSVLMPDFEAIATEGEACLEFGSDPGSRQEYVSFPKQGQWIDSGKRNSKYFGDHIDFSMFDEEDYKCPSQTLLIDDHAWMMEDRTLENFEPVLLAHELAHALGIPHGDGFDNDGEAQNSGINNQLVDDEKEDLCSSNPSLGSGRVKCLPSGYFRAGGGVGGDEPDDLPEQRFDREECIVTPFIDGPVHGEANLMQSCWNIQQDRKFNKFVDESDKKHKAQLSFEDNQFNAMAQHALRCGFGVSRFAGADDSQARASTLAQAAAYSVERFDAWGDAEEELEHLDIGEFGYEVRPAGPNRADTVKFGVSFDRNLVGESGGLRLLLGIDTDGKRRTGGSFTLEKGDREGLIPGFEGADFFFELTIFGPSEQDFALWRVRGGSRERVRLNRDFIASSFQPIVIPAGANEDGSGERVIGHRVEIEFSEGTFPAKLDPAASLAVFTLGSDGTIADVAVSRGIRRFGAPKIAPNRRAEPVLPTCTIQSKGGFSVEKMPRSGNVVVSAKGLSPGFDLELDINGRRIREISGVKTSAKGTVTFELSGDQIPLSVADDSGRPVVLSVGAGASTAICGFQFYRNVFDIVPDCNTNGGGAFYNGWTNCPHYDVCETGRFEFFPTDQSVCPDGSPAQPGNKRALGPHADADVVWSGCLLPVNSLGEPNCYNLAFNMPPGARFDAPGLGLAYNFSLWSSQGKLCNPYAFESIGVDLHSNEELTEVCFSDEDQDGVPRIIDDCPNDYGINYTENVGDSWTDVIQCPVSDSRPDERKPRDSISRYPQGGSR